MITGFEELMKMMLDARRRRLEEIAGPRPTYRLDERGALVIERNGRGPAHPRECV